MLYLLAILCSFLSLVYALPLVARDVWVPPIIIPGSNTTWVAGCSYTVTWNTTGKPTQVTNSIGQVYLRHGDATQNQPIAQNFQLTDGAVNITIPSDTQPLDDQWMVVLFGDSGNWSPPFRIVAPYS